MPEQVQIPADPGVARPAYERDLPTDAELRSQVGSVPDVIEVYDNVPGVSSYTVVKRVVRGAPLDPGVPRPTAAVVMP